MISCLSSYTTMPDSTRLSNLDNIDNSSIVGLCNAVLVKFWDFGGLPGIVVGPELASIIPVSA
jgi:hypothetical protein